MEKERRKNKMQDEKLLSHPLIKQIIELRAAVNMIVGEGIKQLSDPDVMLTWDTVKYATIEQAFSAGVVDRVTNEVMKLKHEMAVFLEQLEDSKKHPAVVSAAKRIAEKTISNPNYKGPAPR